jgi:RNA polymerase sigma-70 factor (ECF subfamily)
MEAASSAQSPRAGASPTAAGPVDFQTLYKQQLAYVWRTLRRLGVRERDLPDLVHDLFVVVFRKVSQYDPSRPVKPWLFGIAFRVVSDYRRSARYRREVLGDPPETKDHAPAADEQLAVNEAREFVTKILDELDLERRAVFVMHDLDEQPVSQIAATLDIPTATAYSRLRLAREDVAAAMKRWRAREEGRRT